MHQHVEVVHLQWHQFYYRWLKKNIIDRPFDYFQHHFGGIFSDCGFLTTTFFLRKFTVTDNKKDGRDSWENEPFSKLPKRTTTTKNTQTQLVSNEMKSGYEIIKLINTLIGICVHYFKRNIFSVNYSHFMCALCRFLYHFSIQFDCKMIKKLN